MYPFHPIGRIFTASKEKTQYVDKLGPIYLEYGDHMILVQPVVFSEERLKGFLVTGWA